MATIQINNNWRVRGGERQWVLESKGISKKKNVNNDECKSWMPRSFYGKLGGALTAYKNKALRESDAETIAQLEAVAKRIEKEIELILESDVEDVSATISDN